MNKALKYALIGAGVVFTAGVSVGVYLAVKNKKESIKTITEIDVTPENDCNHNCCCEEACTCKECYETENVSEKEITEETKEEIEE